MITTDNPTTGHAHRARRLVLALTITALALTASGCAQEKPLLTQSDLDARPALAAVITRYDEMQERVRAAVDAAMGRRAWTRVDESGSEGDCGRTFAVGVVGTSVTMPSWEFDAPITDAEWPAVKEAVLDVVAGYGFQPAGMALDTGTRHELNAFDPTFGARFNIGNDLATVMQVMTDCHPDEKHA